MCAIPDPRLRQRWQLAGVSSPKRDLFTDPQRGISPIWSKLPRRLGSNPLKRIEFATDQRHAIEQLTRFDGTIGLVEQIVSDIFGGLEREAKSHQP